MNIDKDKKIRRIKWIALLFIGLFVAHFIIMWASGSIFGNTSWSFFMLAVAAFMLAICAIFNRKKMTLCVSLGYILGFVVGIIFDQPTVYETRDDGSVFRMSSWSWAALWIAVLLGAFALGILIELGASFCIHKEKD